MFSVHFIFTTFYNNNKTNIINRRNVMPYAIMYGLGVLWTWLIERNRMGHAAYVHTHTHTIQFNNYIFLVSTMLSKYTASIRSTSPICIEIVMCNTMHSTISTNVYDSGHLNTVPCYYSKWEWKKRYLSHAIRIHNDVIIMYCDAAAAATITTTAITGNWATIEIKFR